MTRLQSLRKAVVLLLVTCIAALLAACGSGSGGSSTPGSGTGTKSQGSGNSGGSLIISRTQGFVDYSIKDGSEKPLITPPDSNTFLLDPAVSPDNKSLAYIVQPPPKVEGNKYDAGSDLWVANRDGTGQHVVFAHAQPNQLVRFPQWQDNTHILAVVQEISTVNGVTSVVYTLESIDATTGQRANVIENVLAFGLSPDGKTIAYAKLAPQTGETLESQAIAGGNEKTLVDMNQNLSPFNVPRYSPDGSKIAFASADQTGARAPVTWHFATFHNGEAVALPRATLLDGLPEDIWTIDATGSPPVRIADLKEDLPALTWGGDGKHVYVIGTAGLYDVNVNTGAVNRIGEGAFHGQLAWTP